MIFIVDNFLDKKDFNDLKAFSKSEKVKYTTQFFHGSNEKVKETTYGLRYNFSLDSELGLCLSKTCFKKFNYKITNAPECGLDKRRLNMYQPHTDKILSKINLYLQIEGGTKLNHGLGFYTENNLDIHIGFKENRAVLFNSDIIHSPLVDEEVWRTTLTVFIKEGYFV
jgi:hypothetical protein